MTNVAITLTLPCRALVTVRDPDWQKPRAIAACVGATKDITHQEWCIAEARRINGTGGHASVEYVTKRACSRAQPERHCHVAHRSDEVLEAEAED